jgi:hypothetical protein
VKASDYGFASSGMAERIVALRNFMLNSGKTSDITLAVFGYELRIVAEMKGNLPPHGIVPSLHCTLYRLTTAGPLAVPLPSGPELPGAPQEPPFWTCTFHTESPLRSGLYRLSLSGQGRLVYFGVAQM